MVIGRLGHEASPTTPYTDAVWTQLRAVGDKVDRHLEAHHVRLTMGGEPTFNAREHVDAPEWNGDAMGPTKLPFGRKLAHELRQRIAPGAAIVHRPGKWYPGESLPRWALEIVGRRDKTPLWPERSDLFQKASDTDAERFARALLRTLGLAEGRQPLAGLRRPAAGHQRRGLLGPRRRPHEGRRDLVRRTPAPRASALTGPRQGHRLGLAAGAFGR